MDSNTSNSEVRFAVAQCYRSLTASTDSEGVMAALETFHSYLDEGLNSGTPTDQREEFRRAHFTRTLQFLVSNIQADWLHRLSAARRAELWDSLFLKGPPEQTLLVLMQGIGDLRYLLFSFYIFACIFVFPIPIPLCFSDSPSNNLDHLVSITERFLRTGRLADLLWFYCQQTGPCDSPQFRETLIGRVVGLPDLTANKLQLNNKVLFSPQQYYPLLAAEMLTALERTCKALKGKSTSLSCQC